VPPSLGEANCADLVIITPDDALDSGFLTALFNSAWGIASVRGNLVGSAQQHFNVGAAKGMEVHLPPLSTQRKIAATISAYGDLIETNNRRIKLLEEIAQVTYRNWFVDLVYPGHKSVQLVMCGEGMAPEGWEMFSLSHIAETITRGVSPRYAEGSEQTVVNQKCIRNRRLDLSPARGHVTAVPVAKTVRYGDVLVNSTGVGTLGRVAQVLFEPCRLTVDSHVTIVRPHQQLVEPDFFGLTIFDRESKLATMGTGSTGQTELSRGSIGDLTVMVPPIEVQKAFAKVINPMRIMCLTLATANSNLRRTRDFILPRLISGQIDVTDLNIATREEAA